MSIVIIENISKGYGDKSLFENLSFTIDENQKIGLIGTNGSGKTSMLDIISGLKSPDSGKIIASKNVKIEYLRQDPEFDPNATVIEQIFKSDIPVMNIIKVYEELLEQSIEHPEDQSVQDKLLKQTTIMNSEDAWNLESKIKTILTKLSITNFEAKMGTLSGGQRKRVALAASLITPCDLLILDEPTNHMDNDVILWLEKYLKDINSSILMITHDRYFLDRVTNKIIELDNSKLYSYDGNYSYFVEKKAERRELSSTMEDKRVNLYKKELAWIRTGAKARTTKQKARIDRFDTIKNTSYDVSDENVEISVAHTRMGKKTIELENISKSFPNKEIIKDFSYIVLRDDRIGIIGDNGAGKSTLLNLITGKLTPDSGTIDIGDTIKMGYFSQVAEDMNEDLRAIEYIREHAEFVTTSDGSKISASQMMEKFLFNKDMQWTYISKLSGGEKRRLYLLKVLIESPNVLILDEPTNDLDIDTLKVLESYIDDFAGIVITVSHDRYFLDRVCNKIFSFENSGVYTHVGNYSDYLEYAKLKGLNEEAAQTPKTTASAPKKQKDAVEKVKFTFKEKFEFETIDAVVEEIETKISTIEEEMLACATDFVKLADLQSEKDNLEEELLEKMERQEYLHDINDRMKK